MSNKGAVSVKKFHLVLLALFALCLSPVQAMADETKDEAYLSAVDRSVKTRGEVDWRNVRALYVQASFYDPYGGAQAIWYALQRAGQQVVLDPSPENVKAYKKLLRDHFGHYRSHLQAIDFAKKTASPHIDHAFEVKALKGIIETISSTGDGKTPETAFEVIDPAEEHMILKAFRYQLKGQDFRQKGGHYWDVLKYVNPMTGAEGEMFFNVDIILRSPRRH